MWRDRILNIFEETFLTEKRRENPGLAYEISRKFVNGLAVWKDKIRLVIPWGMFIFISIFLLALIITNIVINTESINWFNTVVEINFCYPGALYPSLLKYNTPQIRYLNDQLDAWWSYRYLEEQTEELKRDAEKLLKKFYFGYYSFTVYGVLSYGTLPLGRYIFSDRNDLTAMFLYQIWVPFALDSFWIAFAIYCFELGSLFLLFFSFGCIAVYMVTVVIVFGHQLQLIGIAFLTMEDRVKKMVEENIDRNNRNWNKLYAEMLRNEIRQCALHYQHLYRILQTTCDIFTSVTNVLYYTGICLIVYAGIALTTAETNKFLVIQGVMLCATVMVNQYLTTFISVYMADQAADLRITVYSSSWYEMPVSCRKDVHLMQTMLNYTPKLTTMLGAECNMEYLSKIINSAYYYFSALYSMNIRPK